MNTKMKFKFTDNTKFMSHILLQNKEQAKAVAETNQWKDNKELEATLQINGVDVSVEVFESFLQDMYNNMENRFKEKYGADKFDQRVEKEVLQIIKNHTDNLLHKLSNLCNVLEDPENLITPHWERK